MTDDLGTVRWFGEPWGRGGRAPVCADDRARIEVPVGVPCASCDIALVAADQGVSIPMAFGSAGDATRYAAEPRGRTRLDYHLKCWLATIMPVREARPGKLPPCSCPGLGISPDCLRHADE